MKFEKEVLEETYKDQKIEFEESGTCERCEEKKVPLKLMYGITNNYGDGKETKPVNELWTCFECYKRIMKNFKDSEATLYKMFRPEWIYNGMNNTWQKVKVNKFNKITEVEENV